MLQDKEIGSERGLVEILGSISLLEEDEPRKGTKLHKEWQSKLVKLYTEYNSKIGFKAFKENL